MKITRDMADISVALEEHVVADNIESVALVIVRKDGLVSELANLGEFDASLKLLASLRLIEHQVIKVLNRRDRIEP